MNRTVGELEFRTKLIEKVSPFYGIVKSVTGPKRSGSVCAVYASYLLGVPFIPFHRKMTVPEKLCPILIVDTAHHSGSTIRHAERVLGSCNKKSVYLFKEPPIVRFFYMDMKEVLV